MTPVEIMANMQKKSQQLTIKNDEYVELAEDAAQKKRDYKKALAAEILKLKSTGTPITIIKDIAKGSHVADLKFESDVAEAICKANLNSIKILIAQIDLGRSLLTWERAELQSR
jgi:hypothetical protein